MVQSAILQDPEEACSIFSSTHPKIVSNNDPQQCTIPKQHSSIHHTKLITKPTEGRFTVKLKKGQILASQQSRRRYIIHSMVVEFFGWSSMVAGYCRMLYTRDPIIINNE